MFEFAAGQVKQEERERQIAGGLRRHALLAAASTVQHTQPQEHRAATIQRRAQTPARVNAER